MTFDEFVTWLQKRTDKTGYFTIHWNRHKGIYETAEQCIVGEPELHQFRNDAQRQRSIDNNEMWVLHWYSRTPVGFHRFCAPTLQELIEFATEEYSE